MEQIKPGAGKDTKHAEEDIEEGTMPAETPPKKMSSVLRWRRPSNATKPKAIDDSEEKLTAQRASYEKRFERGKFIEDISSSGSMDQDRSRTLKKIPRG